MPVDLYCHHDKRLIAHDKKTEGRGWFHSGYPYEECEPVRSTLACCVHGDKPCDDSHGVPLVGETSDGPPSGRGAASVKPICSCGNPSDTRRSHSESFCVNRGEFREASVE